MSVERIRMFARAATVVVFFWTAARAEEDRRLHSRDEALFSQSEYMSHVSYLASDELEGRGTGQPGIDRAAEYIAEHFKRCGVKPAGDDGTYFQNFTLKLKNKLGPETWLSYGVEGKVTRRTAKLREDYVPFPFSGKGAFKGDVVFVGYGLSDDEYDDYKDVDVSEKVVLMLRRSPQFRDFGLASMGFRAKASRANALEAAAILVVNPLHDEDGDKLYTFEGAMPGGGMMGGRMNYGVPMIHIRRALADKLLKAGGLPTLAELEKRIESRKKPASAPLKGVTVKGVVDIEPEETPVRNVIGLIPGAGPQKDEIIVLGGHYDHLGIRNKGEPTFDAKKDISNGADDNASGTALVMQMAKVYTEGKPPNRSLLLMLFTAEELGLLGSAHFAKEPTVDLDQVVAMLNFDMVGRLKDDKLEVGGMRTGDFEEMVERLAGPYGFKIKDGGGGRGPSDHTSFYNKNIPVLFFFTGIHKQYHRPEDDTELINPEGAIRITKLAADIIDEIDGRAERPPFKKDTRRAEIAMQDGATPPGGPGERGRRGFGDRPRLGIRPDMDAEGEGVAIAEVMEGSAAEKGGLQEGDVLVAIGKTKVRGAADLFGAMGGVKWGDKVAVKIKRGGKAITKELVFEKPAEAIAQADAPAGEPTDAPATPSGLHAKDLAAALAKALEGGASEVRLNVEGDNAEQYEITLSVKKTSKRADATPAKAERAPAEPRRESRRAETKPKAKDPHADSPADPHGDTGDDTAAATMPPVRLGILPTYGESDGEGYEIAGVVEGGPAARAGIRDDDRIYQIGDKKITNVYEYMDALRKYKAGDEVPVTVLRGDKKVLLKVRSAAQKSREAA